MDRPLEAWLERYQSVTRPASRTKVGSMTEWVIEGAYHL